MSAEVVADDVEGMLTEGRHFAKLADNIVVKVAMSENGLEAISRFKAEGIKTNCTLIFSANQGLLAAKAGASLLSPFVGRVDDTNEEGMIVIRELSEIVNFYDLDAEVLAASIRGPRHITDSALAGAHIATLPFKVLQQMVHHPLTDTGIVKFKQDWESARASMASRPDIGRARPPAGALRLAPPPRRPRVPARSTRHDRGRVRRARSHRESAIDRSLHSRPGRRSSGRSRRFAMRAASLQRSRARRGGATTASGRARSNR